MLASESIRRTTESSSCLELFVVLFRDWSSTLERQAVTMEPALIALHLRTFEDTSESWSVPGCSLNNLLYFWQSGCYSSR